MTPPPRPSLTPSRRWQIGLALGLTALMVLLLAAGIDRQATHPGFVAAVLVLFAVNTLRLAGSAVTVAMGRRSAAAPLAPAGPLDPCAVTWLLCDEDPLPIARRVRQMSADLIASGQPDVTIFVLSDSRRPQSVATEAALFEGMAPNVRWRNRAQPSGKKPGNLRDWHAGHGAEFGTMLVLDADSGFSARRLLALRRRMQAEPSLGLIQCATRLRPGPARFTRLQRLSWRLGGPAFVRGLARLSGEAGNSWGHNLLLRVPAYAQVATLPRLGGRAPWGGDILSHDFIEAALIRRAGWGVVIDAESLGSHEDPPASVAAHRRRDRRWAQGNLQHLRLLAMPGLHPSSRLHLLAGIHAYLSAPIWLALVLLMATGAVHLAAGGALPLVAMAALLLAPKLAALRLDGRATPARRRVRRRALLAELVLSTLVAPLQMVRQTGAVLGVLAGRDCGWQPAGSQTPVRTPLRAGLPEALAGLGLLLAVAVPQMLLAHWAPAPLVALALVMPLALPLLAAPLLIGWLDAPVPRRNPVSAYYDTSTRRFLRLGGSGASLAIHRPLWAAGIATPEAAAAHANALVAGAAESALGRAPGSVCDLGCGVGGTLFHLADRWPEAVLTGVTLSAVQVDLGRRHADARGLTGRVRLVQGDFARTPTLPAADLVLAIESHVHAADAASFLRAARAHLREGGVVVIVDDMLARPEAALSPRDLRLIDQLRRGWRLGHVTPADTLIDEARALGFEAVGHQDLSPLLRLDRLRDRALRLVGPLADALGLARWPVFANMIGGNALTQGHRRGIIGYRLVVLRAPGQAAAQPRDPASQSAAA